MTKDYFIALLDWCKVNIFLWHKSPNILFKEKELWWCRVGINVGVEIFGKGDQFARPVLILKKLNKESFLGIPLTSRPKDGSWYAPVFHAGRNDRAMLNQIKVFDGKRLIKRMETIGDDNFTEVKNAFLRLYG